MNPRHTWNAIEAAVAEARMSARFEGGPLDYQLVEEDHQRDLTRLSLLISPWVPIADEQAVIGTTLDALRTSRGAANLAQAI